MKVNPDKLILDQHAFLRLDGFPCCKLVEIEGEPYLEFFDRDRLRSSCRGDHFLRISLKDFKEQAERLLKPKM